MTDDLLHIGSAQVRVGIDARRGADIRSVVDRRTGIELMFRTPWVERAAQHSALSHPSSADAWLAGYQGGWNLLCPNAGAARVRAGVEQGFHGEAALLQWEVDRADARSATLHIELFTAPLRIERQLRVDGPTLTVQDTVRNLARVPVEFDYQHHPAFAAPLLGPDCVIETGARTYVVNPETPLAPGDPLQPGQSYAWPPASGRPGRGLDRLPEDGDPAATLGWLTDFTSGWAALRNPTVDLAAVLSWDTAALPHAWLWRELSYTTTFPWYGRAYVLAIEPSSTCTSGPGREHTMSLPGHGSRQIVVRLSVSPGGRAVVGVDPDGRARVAPDA